MTIAIQQVPATAKQSVNAVYKNSIDAEAAVRLLSVNGIPLSTISIIGRNFETVKQVQGCYRPAETKLSKSEHDAWHEGIFALMVGGIGIFVFPTLGTLMVLGPLAGALAAEVSRTGTDGLKNTFNDLSISKETIDGYLTDIQAGKFLVLVHGFNIETSLANEILQATKSIDLKVNRSY